MTENSRPKLPTPDQVRNLDASGAAALAQAMNPAPAGLTDVEKLAALDTYLKVLGETASALRASVTAEMGARHDERVGAFLPDGTKIASITRSSGNRKARITDEAAALKWCQNRYPTEVVAVEMIRPAFLKKLMDVAGSLPLGSKGLDAATGEELPFIEVQQGAPYVTVTKTDEGKARMTALAHGFAGMLEAPKYEARPYGAEELPDDLSYEEQYGS
jgi:hypothetical protein